VLSLPIIEFPESPPVNGMLDYDEFWPYVSSSNLRFSYGVLKKTDWAGFQAQFAGDITPDSIALLTDAGVCGILVDTFGYPDHAASLVAHLQELTGSTAIASPAGRWEYVPVSAP
jgi:phosphoglycerol transferase